MTDRQEIAAWLAKIGFPFAWDVSARPPNWLLEELAVAWYRRDATPYGKREETVEDYAAMLAQESLAFRD